jgi:bifunctional NMN adenylyltransferase/nudix hydrolase
MNQTEYAIFICRCQPPSVVHFQTINTALQLAKKVIIVLGSYKSACTIKNPFTYETRKELIFNSYTNELKDRIITIPMRDYMYNDNMWITSLQNKISEVTNGSTSIRLIGHFKDDTSYYLKFFPQWELINQDCVYDENRERIDSTKIRTSLFKFENTTRWTNSVVNTFLSQFKTTDVFKNLQKEFDYIETYKKQWEKSPYPPTFVTVDCTVIQSGHVLVIKRKTNPGKGLYALPGGFLNIGETIEDGAIRELKEETKIDVHKLILRKSIKNVHVFDHPNRSMRGRTITHNHLIVLDSGDLPKVKAADDAAQALWLSFNDLIHEEEKFFEDHFHMINYFIYNE